MTRSVCCDHGKMFFIYNLFYINFLQVFSIKFAVNLFSRHLVYFSGTTMEIRVTRPFIVSFIPGDQYGGPDCFISCLHVLFTEINQIKSNQISPPLITVYSKVHRLCIHKYPPPPACFRLFMFVRPTVSPTVH